MDPRTYLEWKALDDIEGIAWKRDDLRFAQLMAWFASSHGVSVEEQEFLPPLTRLHAEREAERRTNGITAEEASRMLQLALNKTTTPRWKRAQDAALGKG